MNRKLILLYGIAVGIFVLAGSFFYWYGKHSGASSSSRPGEQYGVEYREPGEIVVEDLGDKKKVTDKRQGYSVEVPKDWKVETPDTTSHSFNFYQQEAGCKISSALSGESFDIDAAIKSAEDDHQYMTIQQYEVQDRMFHGLSGKYVVLKSIEGGHSETVYLPTARGTFSASVFIQGKNAEPCLEGFEDIITSLVSL